MGYCCDGSGGATIKRDKEVEARLAADKLNRDGDCAFDFDFYSAHDGSISLSIVYRWDKWHEESISQLDAFKGCLEDGTIEFVGEDGCHWKYEYDTKKSEWNEYNGRVVYDDEEQANDSNLAKENEHLKVLLENAIVYMQENGCESIEDVAKYLGASEEEIEGFVNMDGPEIW